MQTESGKTLAAILGLTLMAAVLMMVMALLPSPNRPRHGGTDKPPSEAGLLAIATSEGSPASDVSENADTNQEQKTEPGYLGGWFTKENAPDWVMAVITFGGLGIAIWQISEAKKAVWLTERADILLSQVGFKPRAQPFVITGATEFSFVFKNFGPTRASRVRTQVDLKIKGATAKKIDNPFAPIPPNSIGANDDYTISFPPLGNLYSEQDIAEASKGNRPLTMTARVDYYDVFGAPHHLKCESTYYGASGTFILEGEHEAT